MAACQAMWMLDVTTLMLEAPTKRNAGSRYWLSAFFSAPSEMLAKTKSAEYWRQVAMPSAESVSSPASADIE
ncbi:hypothetical protein D9M71_701890 [compost metagenome]